MWIRRGSLASFLLVSCLNGYGAVYQMTLEPTTTCRIDKDPVRVKLVDSLMAAGSTDKDIAATLKAAGLGVTAGSVSRHRATCRSDSLAKARFAASQRLPKDFAVLVRDEAARLLEEGDLEVTAAHGLTAQMMLDKREERTADRRLAINIARMLAGTPAPPNVIIEGVVIDLDEEYEPEELALLGRG
jgi:hypothetical protein